MLQSLFRPYGPKLHWQIQHIAEQVKERIAVSSFTGNTDGGITMRLEYQFDDDSCTQMWRIYATGRNPTHVSDSVHDVILSLVEAENAKYKVSLTDPSDSLFKMLHSITHWVSPRSMEWLKLTDLTESRKCRLRYTPHLLPAKRLILTA